MAVMNCQEPLQPMIKMGHNNRHYKKYDVGMKVKRGYSRIARPMAATIGNFDGVHLGHKAMLTQLITQANTRQLPVYVILFEPQPAEYFNREQAPARLSSLREKITELKRCGIQNVICLPFNEKLANMDAQEFVTDILFDRLNVRYLLVGEDFRYGHKRQGNYPLLFTEAKRFGAEVNCFPDFVESGQRVSSTRVRKALMEADFARAQSLLGHPYRLCGRVMHGAERGRKWGIPTANIALRRVNLVLHGVYHVLVHRTNNQCLPAIANIGTRPTVDGSQAYLEVHILDFDSSLYGEILQIEFLHKLREERKFSSVEALIEQIRCDIQSCYDFFNIPKIL